MCKEALSLTWDKDEYQGKEWFMVCLGWSLAQELYAKGEEAKREVHRWKMQREMLVALSRGEDKRREQLLQV